MVQGYYTLQEAAQLLSLAAEELKQMAQKGQIRSFQDRGTLRFRIQDIQELARARGGTSDPELVLGDASLPAPPKSTTPSSGRRKSSAAPRTPSKQQEVPDVFEFEFDNENVDLGGDFLAPPSGPKIQGGAKSKRAPSPPPPAKGSDSDVRLISDGSDVTFSLAKDSDIKLADSAVKAASDPHKPKTSMTAGSGGKRSSQLALGSGVQAPTGKTGLSARKQQISPKPGSGSQPVDSGVRLVPLDSDSDVKILGASDEVPLGAALPPGHTDSNVRLDRVQLPPADSGEGTMMLTEEINLDEEIRKLEESGQNHPPTKMKAKSELKFPTTSPFELSDSEMKMPSGLLSDSGPKTPLLPKAKNSDSSDFDLLPAGADSLMVEGEDSDFSLEVPDEQVLEQDSATELTSASSGISLSNPVDAGISLEEGGGEDSADFDLSLEVEDTPRPVVSSPAEDSDSDFQLQVGDTPRPVEAHPADDEGSSEFELSLSSETESLAAPENEEGDLDLSLEVDADQAPASQEDDSEFELNLDNSDEAAAAEATGASSEFELTLDDSGNIASLEVEDDSAPQVKSKKGADEEQDIFETDFEVPALDDSDSGTANDSELESSDFDLALDDSELAPEEESGSQVVALDEEDAETLVDSDADAASMEDVEVEEESSDFGALDEDVQVEEGEVEESEEEETGAVGGKRVTVVKEKLLPAAPWGVMPVVFMLPCVIIMFMVGILGYELMQSTAGLRAPGPLTLAIADMIGQPITLKK